MDPQNSQWQRDLSVSYNKLGDLLTAQGNLNEARENYQRGLEIRERLAEMDPQNIGWQRDLGVSYERLASLTSEPVEDRVQSLQDAVAIYRNLAEMMPGSGEALGTLVRGLWQLAMLCQELGTEDLKQTMSKSLGQAHHILRQMQQAEMHLDAGLQQMLDILNQHMGE